jgi:hypothetical protein
MKKTKLRERKVKLSKDTLRALTDPELEAVAGASPITWKPGCGGA